MVAATKPSWLATPSARLGLLVVAVATLVLAVTEVLDFVELPFESAIGHLFTAGSLVSVGLVTSFMTSFGYAGLFVLMFLESASLPIPSEVILPFAGYLVYTGQMNVVAVLAVGTVSGVLGALVDYYLALWLGRPAVERLFKWSGVTSDHLDRAEKWLDTRGAWSILLARFVPGLRSVISLPAGVLKMRRGTFVVMTAVGAFGWSTLLVYLGYSAGSLWQSALSNSSPVLGEAVLLAVITASAAYIAHYFFSLREKKGVSRAAPGI